MRSHRVTIAGRDFDLPVDIKALLDTAELGADAVVITAGARDGKHCPTPAAVKALSYGMARAGAKPADVQALLEAEKPVSLYNAGLGYLMAMLRGATDDDARPNVAGPIS
jgi:hypothetical protein